MKRKLTYSLLIASTVILLCLTAFIMSRQVATANADAMMLPAINQGWFRIKTCPILWNEGDFAPQWLIYYSHRNVDDNLMIPAVLVSVKGRILEGGGAAELLERLKESTKKAEQNS